MTGFSVLLLIVLPVVLISIAVSLWRFRRTHVKVLIMVAHVIASAMMIAFVRVELPLSVIVLGPGMLIALIRLCATAYDHVQTKSNLRELR